jgi:hypothetical protein
VQQSCTAASKLYKEVAEVTLADNAALQRSIDVVRLNVPVMQTATIDDPLEYREYQEIAAAGGAVGDQFNLGER